MGITWPGGHKFAFTVFDDTDWATVEKVKPVYDMLHSLGMRTTKSVWVLRGEQPPINAGSTCEDADYLKWVRSLQQQGFEIGLHNAAPGTSHREQTQRALDRFGELFGPGMIVHCNHADCRENIYWGDARLTGWRRALYNAMIKGRRRNSFRGHLAGDPLFWGDICQERVRYVRNFVFDELNTLAACPEMPYHDPARPYVNYWFASADAGDLGRFLANFTREKIDRLVDDGGLCIAYVHFAARFTNGGEVDSRFRERMEHIASQDGWFAPVSEVLDYLRREQGTTARTISSRGLRRLETKWLANRIRTASS